MADDSARADLAAQIAVRGALKCQPLVKQVDFGPLLFAILVTSRVPPVKDEIFDTSLFVSVNT